MTQVHCTQLCKLFTAQERLVKGGSWGWNPVESKRREEGRLHRRMRKAVRGKEESCT